MNVFFFFTNFDIVNPPPKKVPQVPQNLAINLGDQGFLGKKWEIRKNADSNPTSRIQPLLHLSGPGLLLGLAVVGEGLVLRLGLSLTGLRLTLRLAEGLRLTVLGERPCTAGKLK